MTEALIYLDPDSRLNLQTQIRQKLVEGIVQGSFPAGSKLPSSRKLSEQLGVARNTVVLAYEQLIEEGFLQSRQRSGIFVNKGLADNRVAGQASKSSAADHDARWQDRIRSRTGQRPDYELPGDWQNYAYPFIDGRFDDSLYPTSQWREASRMALGSRIVSQGSFKELDADDPELVEEIRTKMLPRRGINAAASEILITLGEQNALYLITRLLTDTSVKVVMEEPGNPRMRQLLQRQGAEIIPQPVDENGMLINRRLDQAQLIYVTPSHQVPTAVTMPMQRRQALLKKAEELDQLIIEDDFEHESNYEGQPHPALRSMDHDNRVVYVSALPKVLAPGLRIGFIVAARELIHEARHLRQLVIGRPSLVNQRTAALFLSMGHYDSFMMRLKAEMKQRWYELKEALNHYQGRSVVTIPNQGGTVFWVNAPDTVDVGVLTREAARCGILIEPDTLYYSGERKSRNWFRMGVTSIPSERIREGVRRLRDLLLDMSYGDDVMLDENDPGLLRGDALVKMMSGATLIYRTVFYESCTLLLKADGSMTGRAGKNDEDRDTGKWWIENDTWFRQWNHWSYGELEAYRITVNGSTINWYNESGRLVDSAEIIPARD
jgi:GntR family transcriptional regulator/MocR family aminotransferase